MDDNDSGDADSRFEEDDEEVTEPAEQKAPNARSRKRRNRRKRKATDSSAPVSHKEISQRSALNGTINGKMDKLTDLRGGFHLHIWMHKDTRTPKSYVSPVAGNP